MKAAIGDCDAILAVLTSWFRSVGTLPEKSCEGAAGAFSTRRYAKL